MTRSWMGAMAFLLAGGSCQLNRSIGDDLVVRPLRPLNGESTGSGLLPDSLRPTFKWDSTAAATTFHLQVDDSCTSPLSCDFPSPEIDETALGDKTYRPDSLLAISTTAPIGRRYYWRVRACNDDACGPWSFVRHLNVGRTGQALNTDLNGDGYADLVVGAPHSGVGGRAFVYLGGAVPSGSASLRISSNRPNDQLGITVAMAGDVNGDGFGDFLVRTNPPPPLGGARVLIFLGAAKVDAEADVEIVGGHVGEEDVGAAGLGDVNGDGFDDIAFGAVKSDENGAVVPPRGVEVHLGGTTMGRGPDATLVGDSWSSTTDLFGSSVARAGDVNGDGYADVVVGSRSRAGIGDGTGTARVYFGGPSLTGTADLTMGSLVSETDHFGWSVAGAGDLNADGFSDVIVGAPGSDGSRSPLGQAYVYFGDAGMDITADLVLGTTVRSEWFGIMVSPAGDLDGDGFDDVAVVAAGVGTSGRRIDVFRGGHIPDDLADMTLAAGPSLGLRRGFGVMDLDGDSRLDVTTGVWPADERAPGRVSVYLGSSDYAAPAITLDGSAGGDWFGVCIAR